MAAVDGSEMEQCGRVQSPILRPRHSAERFLAMAPTKRKRDEEQKDVEMESASSASEAETNSDEGELVLASEDDDDENEFIQQSIAKRNIKDGAELLKKTSTVKGKGKAKNELGGGSFQSMGLHPSLLRALTLRGYRTPTPIQRSSIPTLLSNPPRDLVGMARTGSGKTLAYMIPLLQRLGGRHSGVYGARALILVPSRELAVQVLKVGRELSRGWREAGDQEHAGERDESGPSTSANALRWALVVGGEGLDEQFETMANNPDVIIATPGRLLHLLVEMSLNLSTIQYLVFDEADRLFELGFSTHLTSILEKLPSSRQTLLFSATLPKSLVEFAKAGLREPKLVRLDSETKISADLRMAFWSVREGEKDAALLCLLREVIGVPLKKDLEQRGAERDKSTGKRAKNSTAGAGAAILAPHQTIVFVSTQHHVAYISALLTLAGYAVSSIHGTLTQAARTSALGQFLDHKTSVLVTTDVAARGIDIPILENVVNYDFPVGNRVFVHRVGRTARMGRKGWAWSFVARDEVPYVLDLQLFLGRPLVDKVSSLTESAFVDSLVLGPFPRDALDQEMEYIRGLDDTNYELTTMRGVMQRGTKMYNRTKGKASPVSYSRAKEFISNGKWGFVNSDAVHPAWKLRSIRERGTPEQKSGSTLVEPTKTRESLLESLARFKPSETVFEIGTRGKTAGALLMKERRRALSKAASRVPLPLVNSHQAAAESSGDEGEGVQDVEMADERDIESAFGPSTTMSKSKASKRTSFKDEDFYMSHYQKDADTERGYSLRDGASFAEQAAQATFDLTTDVGAQEAARRQSQLKWDRKKKKFVKGDGAGADNVKMIKTEGGTKLPVTYKSGRYDEWIKGKGRGREIRIGETENPSATRSSMGGKRWKHSKVSDAKPLDKLAINYERKMRVMKKQAQTSDAQDRGDAKGKAKGKPGKGQLGGRWKGKSSQKVKNELKTVDQIRKQRNLIQRRKEKNARASRKGKGKR